MLDDALGDGVRDQGEDEEHRRFGQTGFQGVVDNVADIEKSLGIYYLSQFTPT